MDGFKSCSYLPSGYLINNKGDVMSPFGKVLKQHISNSGYLFLNIKNKGYFIHRALAFCFIGIKHGSDFVNHIDGNKKNNDISNLEWCTKSENALHSYRLGLKKESVSLLYKGKFGKDHNRSIDIICNGITYNGYSEASRILGINIATIHYRVKSKNKKWMHFQMKK
jgi:hypothetical protein